MCAVWRSPRHSLAPEAPSPTVPERLDRLKVRALKRGSSATDTQDNSGESGWGPGANTSLGVSTEMVRSTASKRSIATPPPRPATEGAVYRLARTAEATRQEWVISGVPGSAVIVLNQC